MSCKEAAEGLEGSLGLLEALLTPKALRAVARLSEGPATLREVAKASGVSYSSASRLLKRLCALGLARASRGRGGLRFALPERAEKLVVGLWGAVAAFFGLDAGTVPLAVSDFERLVGEAREGLKARFLLGMVTEAEYEEASEWLDSLAGGVARSRSSTLATSCR